MSPEIMDQMDRMLDPPAAEDNFPGALVESMGKLASTESPLPEEVPSPKIMPPSVLDRQLEKALAGIKNLKEALLYSDDSRARKMLVGMTDKQWIRKGWTAAALARYNRITVSEIATIVGQYHKKVGELTIADAAPDVARSLSRDAAGVRLACRPCSATGKMGEVKCPECSGKGYVVRAGKSARSQYLEAIGWTARTQININSNNQTVSLESVLDEVESGERGTRTADTVVDVEAET